MGCSSRLDIVRCKSMPFRIMALRYVCLAVLGAFLVLGVAAVDPPRPNIPPEYQSAVRFDLQSGGLVRHFNGTMKYSNDKKENSMYGAA